MSESDADVRSVSGWVVFNNRDFLLYSIARFLSTIAYQMEVVAVSWLVYDITHDAFALGLAGLTSFLPAFGFALVTGHAADRFERRTLLAVCFSAAVLIALGLLAYILSGSREVWPIFLLIFAMGTARAFAGPAGQALVPTLVPKNEFSQAIAWNSSIFHVGVIFGPAFGGFLYAVGGAVVFGTTAGLFVLTVLCLFSIARRPIAGQGDKADWTSLMAGIHYIRAKPIIFGAISFDLFAVLLGGATALLPIYARDILQTGPWGLGLMRSMPAVGAVLMALLLAHRPMQRQTGRRMFYAVVIFGLATIGFGLSRNLFLSMAFLFVLGAADMVSVIIRQTLVQIETPDIMRGRVAAVNTVFIGASNELGEFESGAMAALVGVAPSVVLGGVGTIIVAGLWSRWFPELWKRDRLIE